MTKETPKIVPEKKPSLPEEAGDFQRLYKVVQERRQQSQPGQAPRKSKRKKSGMAPEGTETVPKKKKLSATPGNLFFSTLSRLLDATKFKEERNACKKANSL